MSKKAGWAWRAWEQLGSALRTLVSGGSLQERLKAAAVYRLAYVRPDMVPEQHRNALESIMNRLTREGDFESSIAALSEADREVLARDILELCIESEVAWGRKDA